MSKPGKKPSEKFHISVPADVYKALEKYLEGETRNRSEAITFALKRELISKGYLEDPSPKAQQGTPPPFPVSGRSGCPAETCHAGSQSAS